MGVILGSIKDKSFSKYLAKAMLPFFPEDIQVSLSCIEGLSLFDPDIDKEGCRSVSYDHFRRAFTTKTYHSRI